MSIAEAIQSVGFLTDIRESALTFPVLLSTHLSCIAVFGGMILATDFRLMGIAMTGRSVTDVVNQFRIWKRLGFCIMVTMGGLLGASEAVKYSGNPYFWTKMTLLALVGVHALIFRPLVYNNTAEIDRAPTLPGTAKVAGAISLILWISILSMGRLIGYYEPKSDSGQRVPVAAVIHQQR
jgi:hypothetical protein